MINFSKFFNQKIKDEILNSQTDQSDISVLTKHKINTLKDNTSQKYKSFFETGNKLSMHIQLKEMEGFEHTQNQEYKQIFFNNIVNAFEVIGWETFCRQFQILWPNKYEDLQQYEELQGKIKDIKYKQLQDLVSDSIQIIKQQENAYNNFLKTSKLVNYQPLTQEEAKYRSSIIKNQITNYNVYFSIKTGKSYSGIVLISFDIFNFDSIKDNLKLDFRGRLVHYIKVNDVLVELNLDRLYIYLQKRQLTKGLNTIEISFENDYVNDGEGLHSYIDSDEQQYLYSQGEPAYMNRIFPCFDQPNLRATFELSCIYPDNWICLSNELINTEQDFTTYPIQSEPYYVNEFLECQKILKNVKINKFNKTKPLPTYLYVVCAGNYKQVTVTEKTYNNIPMNLYCRESLVVHFDKIQTFFMEVTYKSFEFYEKFFQFPYPFSKFDQIFVPEFNSGAMENAGLVTYRDEYCWKHTPSQGDMQWLAVVIAHELSHHWFGNLVTINWWNDLWLNESFADFVCHYCFNYFKIDSYDIGDIRLFFNSRKGWGYREDQLNTTHPITMEVSDTQRASQVFDGISYSKGAATLYQLAHITTYQNMSDALGTYFTKYQWQNTQLNNFIDTLQEEFKKLNLSFTLFEWSKQHIETAGMNSLEVQPFDEKSKKIVIKQSYCLEKHQTLRIRKINVAFYKGGEKEVKEQLIFGDMTEVECPEGTEAVLLNYGDFDFVKIIFDEKSLSYFKQNMKNLNDELSTGLILSAIKEMVLRDIKISTYDYFDFIKIAFEHETNSNVITNQMRVANMILISFTPFKYRKQMRAQFFEFCFNQIKKYPQLGNEYKSSIIACAESQEHLQILIDAIEGKEIQGLKLDDKDIWSILSKININEEIDQATKDRMIKRQQEKDKSDVNTKYKLLFEAQNINTLEERQQAWDQYLNPKNELSVQLIQQQMLGFNNRNKKEQLKPFIQKWFENVDHVFATRTKEFAESFYNYLSPISEDLDMMLVEYRKLLETTKSEVLKTDLIQSIESTERQKRSWQLFEKNQVNYKL